MFDEEYSYQWDFYLWYFFHRHWWFPFASYNKILHLMMKMMWYRFSWQNSAQVLFTSFLNLGFKIFLIKIEIFTNEMLCLRFALKWPSKNKIINNKWGKWNKNGSTLILKLGKEFRRVWCAYICIWNFSSKEKQILFEKKLNRLMTLWSRMFIYEN